MVQRCAEPSRSRERARWVITVSEDGQPVGKTTVNAEGIFSTDVPAPSAGEHTYALAESGSSEALNLTLKAAGATPTVIRIPVK